MPNTFAITNLQHADCFSALFQHLKLFSEHINIMFDEEMMYIQCMDSSKVSVFEIFLPKEWFDSYELIDNASTTIGISANMLFKVLNTRDKKQDIRFSFEYEGDSIFIDFQCDDKNTYNKEFTIPLMEIESEIMSIPEMESTADISLPSVNFANAVKDMRLFGDTFNLSCDQENLTMSANSDESGKMKLKITTDDLTSYEIEEDAELNTSYSLNILYNISLYAKLSEFIHFHVKDGFPLKIVYELDNEIEGAKIAFFIAPKIED